MSTAGQPFTDKNLEELKKRLKWKIENKVYEIKMNHEEIEALLARLEAAECVCWAAKIGFDIGATSKVQYSELFRTMETWRKAAGK